MPAPIHIGRVLTWRRVAAVLCVLVVAGVLSTPLQWTVAYLGLERQNRRRRRRERQSVRSLRVDAAA